jgi:hypothetical protein
MLQPNYIQKEAIICTICPALLANVPLLTLHDDISQ